MFMRVGVLLLMLSVPSLGWAEQRIALLIGNESYAPTIGVLANPHNDIALVEQALKQLGFEVTTVRDAGLASLYQAINSYARRLRATGPGTVGFLYYSGHGAQDGGTNYLIPVDVKTTETSELWDQSLRLTDITHKLRDEASNAIHFIVFDACRNTLKLKETTSRSLVQSKGFVPVAQYSGMLIAYATAEGELASDVGTGAGPYARVLAQEILKPGVEAVSMFRNVQLRVRDAVRQEPWLSYGTLSPIWFAGRTEATLPIPPVPVPVRRSEAAEAWEATKNTADATVLEKFIARYRDTYFADLARARLAVLNKSLPSATGGRKPADTSCGEKIAGAWDVAEETVFPATLVMPGHQEANWEFKSDRPLGGVVFLNTRDQKRYSCQGNLYTIHDFFGITLTLAPDGTRLDGECHDLVSAAGGGCRIHAVRK